MDETKLTMALPNLDVQILHRALPDQSGETISITLTATPSFDAAAAALLPPLATTFLPGAFLQSGSIPLLPPFLAQTGTVGAGAEGAASVAQLWLAPARLWMELAQRAWAPWLAMAALRRVSDEP